jgi:hypothetical protein
MRTLLICMATLVAIPTTAQHKAHLFGVKAGLNLSKFISEGATESSFKPGLNVGVYFKAPIAKNVFLRPEVMLSSQGERERITQTVPGITTRHVTNVNYLNIPLLLEAGKKLTVQVGPQIGYLLTATERTIIENESSRNNLRPFMNRFDFSVIAGIGINPHPLFNVGVRFQYGLSNVFANDSGISVARNQVCNVYAGYTF